MERIEVRMRRRSALALVLGSVMFAGMGAATIWMTVNAGQRRGNLLDPVLWLLGAVVSMGYGAPGVFGLVLGVRQLARIADPLLALDDRGITLPSVGLIEWADVRGVEVVRPRGRSPRLRIEVRTWAKYYWRRPRWLRPFDRPPARGEMYPIDVLLGNANVELDTLYDTIRRKAGRHRPVAA